MADNHSSDRTQPATPRRRREARQQGQVWQSGDLSAALALGGGGLLLSWQGAALVRACGNWLQRSFAEAPTIHGDRLVDAADVPSLKALAGHAAGLLIGLWLIAVIVRLVQVGPLFAPQLVRPQYERVSLATGWRRITSAAALFRGPLWLLKLLVIGGVVWSTTVDGAETLRGLSRMEPAQLAVAFGALLLSFVGRLCVGLLAVAAIDALWQWRSHERRLKMPPEQVRAERRESNRTPVPRRPVIAANR